MSKFTKLALLIIVLISVTYMARRIETTTFNLEFKKIEIKSTEAKLRLLNQDYENLLKAKTLDSKKLEQLEKEKKELEQQLQAKLEAKQKAQEAVAHATFTTPVRAESQLSGTCADWIAKAGITDVNNAIELIRRESNCNPLIINQSSGACGVAQELPCGKSGCELGDGYCQVAWMNTYVLQRYGSWAEAVAFHNANNWY